MAEPKEPEHRPDNDPEFASHSGQTGLPALDLPTKQNEFELEATAGSDAPIDVSVSGMSSKSDHLLGTVVLGKYEVQALIGTGGMSRVYKALQILTRKSVALKLLHKHLSDNPVMIRRFQAEAQASHHLAHPHIINVYDFGVTEDNQPFLVMDYLEGRSLSDIIKTWGQLEVNRCLKIVTQVLEALENAHDSGVLHRDLKPSNIVLIPVGEETDYVKLVDFGIAKILPKAGLDSQELTQSGDVFGSPLYMSPEQCLGHMTDARSDIYSMGCLMYECLTGQPPLIGNNTLETMHKQVSEMPAGLSGVKADIRLVKQLEDIIFKAMAKETEKRFQTAPEMRKAIEQTLVEWKGGSAVLAYVRRYRARAARLAQNKWGKNWQTKLVVGAMLFAITAHYLTVLAILYRPGSAPDLADRTIPWTVTNQRFYKVITEQREKATKTKPVIEKAERRDMAEFVDGVVQAGRFPSAIFRSKLYWGTDELSRGFFENALKHFRDAIALAPQIGMNKSIDCAYAHLAAATCLLEDSTFEEQKGIQKNPEIAIENLENARSQARDSSLIYLSAEQGRSAAAAKCLEGKISEDLKDTDNALLAYVFVAQNVVKYVVGETNTQRKREHASRGTRVEFRWEDSNPNIFMFELASVAEFLLRHDQSLNAFPVPHPLNAFHRASSMMPGIICENQIFDYVFHNHKLIKRCDVKSALANTVYADAENFYQILLNLCSRRGSGKGSLPTAVARSNFGYALLKKGNALRSLALEKFRSREFDEANILYEQAQRSYTKAAKELESATTALELHLGHTKYVAYTWFNLSDAQLGLLKFNEALDARGKAARIYEQAANENQKNVTDDENET